MDLETIRARCSQPITEIVASPRDYFRVQQILRDRADLLAEVERLLTVRSRDDYHEDDGPVLWWRFPIVEPPYVGTPTDETWSEHELEGFYTHWSPIPIPMQPVSAEASHE